jgi:hypothetical protein
VTGANVIGSTATRDISRNCEFQRESGELLLLLLLLLLNKGSDQLLNVSSCFRFSLPSLQQRVIMMVEATVRCYCESNIATFAAHISISEHPSTRAAAAA